MESSREMNTVGGTGTSGNCSAASAKVANAPHCRQVCEVRHRVGKFNGRNHRFTVDLSGARPRRSKSEFLSIASPAASWLSSAEVPPSQRTNITLPRETSLSLEPPYRTLSVR